MPPSTKNTIEAVPTTALTVAADEANRLPTSAAAWPFRPVNPVKVFTTDRPASALTTIRNGNRHNNSVAANSTPRLMKSIASSRFHKSSAKDPAYCFLPHCAARRTRRTAGRSPAFMPERSVGDGCPGCATSAGWCCSLPLAG
jgi:hypothetical protein